MAPAGRWFFKASAGLATCALVVFGGASTIHAARKIRYTAVAVEPGLSEKVDAGRLVAADAAALAHLVLTITPHIDVRWRPVSPGKAGDRQPDRAGDKPPDGTGDRQPDRAGYKPPVRTGDRPPVRTGDRSEGGRTLFHLTAPATGSLTGRRGADAVAAARRMLAALPRGWRRAARSRFARLGLERLDEDRAIALLDALGARLSGDPLRAVSLLAEKAQATGPPIWRYLAGAARLEAGDVRGAGEEFQRIEGAGDLPSPLGAMTRAAGAAAAGETGAALSILDGVIGDAPSLAEARVLRASLRRDDCSSYDLERIRRDIAAALMSNPCCAACTLTVAETEAFAGQPGEALALLRVPGCAGEALDSMRDRALSLALAAAGRKKEALEAAARAEARDVSALRRGLAPAFMLADDHAHLDEAYDSEGDLRLAPPVSIEQHLHAGLNALWTGRPSAAAVQFERALEHERALAPPGREVSPLSRILMTLRIRSYLAAGRIDEARRAAADASEITRGRAGGLLTYTIVMTSIASGDSEGALRRMNASGSPEEKLWVYLTQSGVHLAAGRAREALESSNLALARVGPQLTVCPGVSTEPYLLEPQARALLALGRPGDAARVLDRLFGLGARGFFAPDVVVPAWLIAGEAREKSGDAAGAKEAYRALLDRWGAGEETPAVQQARERLRALP